MNSLVLNNIVHMLRCISQNPQFDKLIRDESSSSVTLVSIITEFLLQTCDVLGDFGFLTEGPQSSLKTAMNFCIIVEQLCEAHSSMSRYAKCSERFGDVIEYSAISKTAISMDIRRTIVCLFKDWYEIILETAPTMSANVEKSSIVKLLVHLLNRIGSASSQLMMIGISFDDDHKMPKGFHKWLANLEVDGCMVMFPNVLCNSGDALGLALSSSYAGRGSKSPFTFTKAIFNILLPRFQDNAMIFLNQKSPGMEFAEDYLAGLHLLPSRETKDDHSQAYIHSIITDKEKSELQQHMGSLLFHGRT